MSDCYIRNFNFEPLMTLHVRIQTLLRVRIMLKYSSKKSSKNGLQFEFLLICFDSFTRKVLLASGIKFFHTGIGL